MKVKIVTNPNILTMKYSSDPLINFDGILKSIFSDVKLKGPVNVPVGDVPYEVLSWSVPHIVEFRLLLNATGHILSIRTQCGLFWIISESTESRIPVLHDYDLTDFSYYLYENDNTIPIENENPYHFFPFSDDGEKVYTVDLEKYTCDCKSFKFKGSHYTIDKEERLCKHMNKVLSTYPEFLPSAMKEADKAKTPSNDGKTRYPRSIFDLYVSEIKDVLRHTPFVERFELCGSYRRLAKECSDLDFLIQLKEGESWDPLLDLLENLHGHVLVQQIGRGDKKAGYLIDGFIRVDYKVVPKESWPFATLHFTGSKINNIEMRRRANQLGYKLNEYGLYKEDTNEPITGIETEKDIYQKLNLQYKEPWER